MLLTVSSGIPETRAQSPAPIEEYVMPEELVALQHQYSTLPDCMYEYVVNLYPPLDSVVHKFHYRFMTVRGMWRYERVDENGLMFYKVCFDGKVYHQFFKESDIGRIRQERPNPRYHHAYFTGGNKILITPDPLPADAKNLASTEFAWNPLFAPVEMPFLAKQKVFKTPDLHSASLWQDVMRRSATRHRTGKDTPANQVHFLLDDEALNGILKLEKLNRPGLPPWRVVEHDYMTRAGSMHVVTKYEDWRKFSVEFPDGSPSVLHMPALTTITSKGVPQSSVTTIELLPDTVAKPPIGLTIEDFRIPDTISNPPAQPADKSIAAKSKPSPPTKSAPPPKPAQKPKLGGTELKPPPKLKPAPKL
ncbi:hypothetical protein DES53_1084 [Roseimicrobium gellanilyticum]|uniref:Uncharacterized protein n=1 Tax=Roseimicrobium gellanilyticum TaxID=748857 RepID=A0A366HFQ9_9BACT|nr:hypothetical protein [Roseimicrobium gellanilyticum]RBP40298.1 hypothetical protein DES53_1084 [Roseimicrobium gellanilyticum]